MKCSKVHVPQTLQIEKSEFALKYEGLGKEIILFSILQIIH